MKDIFKGKTFLLLREQHFIEEDKQKLESLGAEVIFYPVIRTEKINLEKLRRIQNHIEDYDIIVFTSIMGVRYFFEDASDKNFQNIDFACIGMKTAKELEKYGYRAKYVPEKYSGDDLAELLLSETSDKRILIARSNLGREDLYNSLSRKFFVDEIHTYMTEANSRDMFIDKKATDLYIIFSSSSTFRFFRDKIDCDDFLKNNYLLSIGPITSNTIKAAGFEPYIEASEYTIDGVIEELKNKLK